MRKATNQKKKKAVGRSNVTTSTKKTKKNNKRAAFDLTGTRSANTPSDIYWSAQRAIPNASWPPHTDDTAVICATTEVENARVVRVEKAKYRHATISGAFAIDPNSQPNKDGRVAVLCRWYGYRVNQRGPQIKVNPKTDRIEENYTGKVITDLKGKKLPPKPSRK